MRDLAGLVLESHLDGVVLAPPLSDSTEVLAELQKHRIRFVRIAPTVDLDAYSCVFMNDVAAAREMTEYLIALGHERIGFINGPPGHPVTEQRYLGYTLALRSHGLDVDPQLVDRGEFTFDSGPGGCAAPAVARDTSHGRVRQQRRHGGRHHHGGA